MPLALCARGKAGPWGGGPKAATFQPPPAPGRSWNSDFWRECCPPPTAAPRAPRPRVISFPPPDPPPSSPGYLFLVGHSRARAFPLRLFSRAFPPNFPGGGCLGGGPAGPGWRWPVGWGAPAGGLGLAGGWGWPAAPAFSLALSGCLAPSGFRVRFLFGASVWVIFGLSGPLPSCFFCRFVVSCCCSWVGGRGPVGVPLPGGVAPGWPRGLLWGGVSALPPRRGGWRRSAPSGGACSLPRVARGARGPGVGLGLCSPGPPRPSFVLLVLRWPRSSGPFRWGVLLPAWGCLVPLASLAGALGAVGVSRWRCGGAGAPWGPWGCVLAGAARFRLAAAFRAVAVAAGVRVVVSLCSGGLALRWG